MNNTALRDLIERFLDHCQFSKSLTSNTLSAYHQDMSEFSAFCGSDISIGSLQVDDLNRYLRGLKAERNLSAATIRRRFACLKAFFRWAKEARYIKTTPFDETSIIIRIPKRLPRTLSSPEISELTASINTSRKQACGSHAPSSPTNIQTTTFLCTFLMLATGLRVSELLGMRLGDIDATCTVIRVHGKGSRERIVFITNSQLKDLFSEYIEARKQFSATDDIVFRNTRNSPLTPQALRLRLRKLGRTLSFPQNLTPHRFRHTAATLLIEEGVDIRFVQRLLGHSSISTTEIYTHVSNSSLRNVLENNDHLEKVMD